jgi:hypothetical protein
MSSRALSNPLAQFTVNNGYLCRVERGSLDYDYPANVALHIKFPKVYQRLVELKEKHNLMHTIVPTFSI